MIGERIRDARKSQNITQETLAAKIGAKRSVISKYETGLIEPTFSQLQRIASALGVTVAYLQGLESMDSMKVLVALKNKDYRELERLMGLPSDSIRPLDTDEEKNLRSQVDEDKRRTEINLNKLHLSMKILHPAFSEDDFLLHQALLKQFAGLNADGQQKAVERVEELTEIPKYQRHPPQDASTAPSGGTDTTPSEKPPEDAGEGTENK